MENNQKRPHKYLFKELDILVKKVETAKLPADLSGRVLAMIERLNRMANLGGYSAEFETISRYIDWVTSLPWDTYSEENLDLKKAQEILDKNHYGMEKVKTRILEYLAVLLLTKKERGLKQEIVSGPLATTRASVLCFVGLPGIGKTSVAYSIAQAMGRKFIRIPMGGMGSATQLRGQAKSIPNAEPGEVIKSLQRAGTKNPVILFDEIDRVGENARAEIMGVLLELLDPEQNMAFTDYYIDFPFDLSSAMFLCSANNTGGIANAVLDRLEVIDMPAYTDEEKKVIGRDYLFPKALKETGLTLDQLSINDNLWPKIIRPLGYDAGIRTLDRTINGICRKVARKIVEGEGRVFYITEENVKEFLPKW